MRHAEKAVNNPADPSLSALGQVRALALATALQYSDVGNIFTTQFKRTRETALPLAQARGITPQMLGTKRGAEHINEVVMRCVPALPWVRPSGKIFVRAVSATCGCCARQHLARIWYKAVMLQQKYSALKPIASNVITNPIR